jgi:GT2 family glycosyltransferase
MRLLNRLSAASRRNDVGDVTAKDVEKAYQFFLGRAVESQAVVQDRIGITTENLASSFLSSLEYQFTVAGPLRRGGRLDPSKFADPPRSDLIAWATARLPLTSETGQSLVQAGAWAQVFQALARDPNMRRLKKDGRAVWSFQVQTTLVEARLMARRILSRLIEAARPMPGFNIVRKGVRSVLRASGLAPFHAQGANTLGRPVLDEISEAIAAVTEGLHLISAMDITRLKDGRFSFTGQDPRIQFAFTAAVAKAPVAEITFAVSGARRRAEGRLYIDYNGGLSEETAIGLTPNGREQYSVLIVSPRQVSQLRWDPDVTSDEVEITSIKARGLSLAQLKALERVQGSTLTFGDVLDGAVRLGAAAHRVPAAFVASRLLTQLIGEHDEFAGRFDYQTWIEVHELSGDAAIKDREMRLAALTDRPLISILVPTYNTPATLLQEMIESVLAQAYDNWQLCIADDASPSPHVREILEGYAKADPRIRLAFRSTNGHISAASNTALELATGDWLAMLDHDDLLTPDALLSVAEEINAHPDAVLIYSDEDKIDELGVRNTPFFKPDYSPVLLLAQNYLNHLTVHRAERVRAVGGWRSGFDGSQDYDLNLRVLEGAKPDQVRHIPKVLYHWRAVEGSTALAVGEKSYATEAARKAVKDSIERCGLMAEVTHTPALPFVRVRHALPDPAPLISLIIPTRDRADLLATCIDSVRALSTHANYEILIADNDSSERETYALFERLSQYPNVRIIPQPGPFNFSAINNAAIAQSRGELVCLLNNDIEVITPDWMEEMASWALQSHIGCVGAKLYYPDDTIQHAGVVIGIGGVAGHSHKYFPRESPGYFARIALHHNVSAVTGACLMVRRSLYDEVDGLDTALQVAFNDVDFCLRVREAGYQNVFTPYAELYHHESISRGAEDNPLKLARFNAEVKLMMDRWGAKLKADPFYSPNLTLDREDYSLEF